MRTVTLLLLAIWLTSASAQAPAEATVSAPNAVIKGEMEMTNQKAWDLYKKYLSAWNADAIAQRLAIAAEILVEDMAYQTVRHDLCRGRSHVIDDMATFHEKFPGAHFEIGDVSAHHNVALVTWVLVQADGREFARGHDQLTVDEHGKISKIITFGPSARTPGQAQ